jgi:two-component system chemotaxis response regulator CheB
VKKIKVLIIDDSALIRKMLTELIGRQQDMVVVGVAADPLIARGMIRALEPDVLTLDVEMPNMDGLDFLERLMRLRPMPVIMVSTLTERGSEFTLRALELGAVDFVFKPRFDVVATLTQYTTELADKIRAASVARIRQRLPIVAVPKSPTSRTDTIAAMTARRGGFADKLIIIGASTGGTEAIKDVLMALPSDAPGVLITQHMPKGFTKSFAERLDSLCAIRVSEAVHGEQVLPGHAYIAPGDQHLSVARIASRYVVQLSDGPPVNRHRPSVEVLFLSAACIVGVNAIGVMLTGMGRDGAAAMLQMKNAGAYNLAQDEETCVVFGMPKEAIAMGAVDEVLPLHSIAGRALKAIHRVIPSPSTA